MPCLILTAIILMLVIYTAMLWFIYQILKLLFVKRQRTKPNFLSIEEIDKLGGVQFEDFLEHLFTLKGYKVERTPVTGDFGADLILNRQDEKIAVQAKCYSNSVGVDAVQQALSGKAYYKCRHAMVITNNKFTRNARKFANTTKVELWDRERLQKEI